ncbi:sterol desaturase family protein [Desulfolithobacter sp.]
MIRLGIALSVLVLMVLWESVAPRRRPSVPKGRRWLINLSVIGVDTLLVLVLVPVTVMHVAIAARTAQWGLFNQITLQPWLAFSLAVLLLDLVIYLQHLMFHAVPLFWRLHMVHHADLDIDASTGLRFHPMEIVLSIGIKMGAVAALGPPPAAVLLFEILLNGTAMFNHGNVVLPQRLDKVLRLLLVTPDMHRVHHSVIIRETSSNFGFSFPWWDRFFGTYRAQPSAGHRGMTIGLSQYRDPARLGFVQLLLLPFSGNPGSYALNRQGQEPKIT